MDQEKLKDLLLNFKEGDLSIDQVLEQLRHLPFEDIGYAHVDHHRALRQGFPEVIFGKGKTPEQVMGIASRLLERSSNLLITHSNRETFASIRAFAREAIFHE